MKALFPRGSFNAHLCTFFSAGSSQIMVGAPIFVYANCLGASSTILGVIAAFSPLMTVCQLPAAGHLARFGYRRFILTGRSMRTALILVVATTPFISFLDNKAKLAVLVLRLFLLNFLRSIFSTAWMPWLARSLGS